MKKILSENINMIKRLKILNKNETNCEQCKNFSQLDNTCYIYHNPNFGISICNDFQKKEVLEYDSL